ncbi:MAG: hypothetical protein AB1631_10040 [Acidobacteriota bacterium]
MNATEAHSCLWCGAIFESRESKAREMVIELEYLDGLERLTDPTPVRLTLRADGIKISEVMPGTRSIWIGADQIVEARASRSLRSVGKAPSRGLLGRLSRSQNPPNRQEMLTIRYRAGEAIHSATFRREESATFSRLDQIARMISSMVKSAG